MSGRRDSLNPPERSGLEDPGAHELDSSDSDDHFSDAQSAPPESHRPSPIPRTRVEKVDDDHSYGEVPGTEAYRMRQGDAEPDEIAVIPDSDAKSLPSPPADEPEPGPVPVTVVEKTHDTDGSVTHPEIEKRHEADPPADLVLEAENTEAGARAVAEEEEDEEQGGLQASETPVSPALKSPSSTRSRRKSSLAKRPGADPSSPGPGNDQENGDGEFGDDFDEFEEGGDDDAEFGDFDDGFQQPEELSDPGSTPTGTTAPPPGPAPAPGLSFPIPDFDGLDSEEIFAAADPYINALFPPDELDAPALPPLSKDNPVFLTPRSASLWSQLVAPPPLQPPDWIRSRIRRLFLVSLGVPVDLDEILPAKKQKKLVLPSLRPATSTGSLRASSSERRSTSRVRRDGPDASTTSVNSQGKASTGAGAAGGDSGKGQSSSRRRKAQDAEPVFDLAAAEQLGMTTEEALNGMTDTELREHIARVEAVQEMAGKVLEYWQKRTDEKIGDREAFEGVIENLVKHARKVRQ